MYLPIDVVAPIVPCFGVFSRSRGKTTVVVGFGGARVGPQPIFESVGRW